DFDPHQQVAGLSAANARRALPLDAQHRAGCRTSRHLDLQLANLVRDETTCIDLGYAHLHYLLATMPGFLQQQGQFDLHVLAAHVELLAALVAAVGAAITPEHGFEKVTEI